MIKVENGLFHLRGENYSYVFGIEEGKACHLYYGEPLDALSFALPHDAAKNAEYPFEFGEFGRGDFRLPTLAAHRDGVSSTDLRYDGYEILPEKPSIGMPALRNGGETLVLTFRDPIAKITLKAFYTPYGEALSRHFEITNDGDDVLVLDKAMAATFDFPTANYEAVTLPGRWAAEREIERVAITRGIHAVHSERGITSHQQNCFMALVSPNTDEESGVAYGFELIYSGNFQIEWERDEHDALRVNVGQNLLFAGYKVPMGESFITPEVVSVYSGAGIGEMSRRFHRTLRSHLIDPRYAGKIRPIVVNSWESMYFDLSNEKLCAFIKGAKGLGIDTVVLDDGWFGKRDNDTTSLGDWDVDERKFSGGLSTVIECTKKCGMKFGIWFEPEAISPVSELYKAHPDWAISTVGRVGQERRWQFTLDFSKPEIVDYIYGKMAAILSKYDISYVKWDMNRSVTDMDDTEKYVGYVRGVYALYEKLRAAFPDVVIEGCSGGGGRFDAGILYYSPFIWTSDNTDARQRTKIQYGTSLCYPLEAMSNHVSNNGGAPFATRGAVASLGCLGYELNVAYITDEERRQIKAQVKAYRRDASLILGGDLYRLRSPFETSDFCELVVSPDKKRAYYVFVRQSANVNGADENVRLAGLRPDYLYEIEETGETVSGAQLMSAGIPVPIRWEDNIATVLHFKKK